VRSITLECVFLDCFIHEPRRSSSGAEFVASKMTFPIGVAAFDCEARKFRRANEKVLRLSIRERPPIRGGFFSRCREVVNWE